VAAALLLGDRLRELFPHRLRASGDAGPAHPHADSFDLLVDVGLYGAWAGLRGLPSSSRVGRHVEYTRAGRRIVRRADGAAPPHRDPDADRVRAMLTGCEHAVHEPELTLPRFRLDEGDVLVPDNRRCRHGRDAHAGDRTVRILTLRSTDAR
jgi:gamma-butyrobetaine dioxygenase